MSMRSRGCIALVLAGIAIPASAINPKQKAEDAAYGRKVMRDFARCSVKYEHALARKYVLMGPAGRLPPEEFWKVADGRCLGFLRVQLRMPHLYFRAALAEELFRKEFPTTPTIYPAGLAPLDWTAPNINTVDPRTGKARSLQYLQLARLSSAADAATGKLGECVVRASPAGALGVVRAKPESPDELAALKVLAPQIAGCIKGGQTRTFNRTNLRAAVALSYYRLTWAAVERGRGAVS